MATTNTTKNQENKDLLERIAIREVEDKPVEMSEADIRRLNARLRAVAASRTKR